MKRIELAALGIDVNGACVEEPHCQHHSAARCSLHGAFTLELLG